MFNDTDGVSITPKDGREENIREPILGNRLGLESIPYQIVKQHLAQGFIFNIMCIGETGIGKSTLISSLFNIDLDTQRNVHKHSEVSLKSTTHNIQEKEVRLQLTVVETVGYGDQIRKENSFEPILNYIDSQFDKYLAKELNPRRQLALVQDTRIHVCLFLISPTGHSLKSLDLLCLKHLDKKVNIIPIIAKADTLTRDELQKFKLKIKMEFEKEKIQIYSFPTDEDPVVDEVNSTLNAMLPFAVVGSTESVVRDGNLVRGRNYPWGSVYVRNENHSDTPKLLEGMIETNLVDLKEQTHFGHYENYRMERLSAVAHDFGNGVFNVLDIWKGRVRKELQKQEEKMIQDFVEKVKRVEQELIHEEKVMRDKYMRLEQKLLAEKRELEEESQL